MDDVFSLYFAGFGKSLLKHCGVLWPTTGWWRAVFVTPRTNWKPWAVVTCAKLAVKSLKGPLDYHRQKVLPSKFCPPFINTFLKPSGFISCTRLECQGNIQPHSQRSKYKGCCYRQSEEMYSSYLTTFCQAERSAEGRNQQPRKPWWPAPEPQLIFTSLTLVSQYITWFFFSPAPEHSVYWGAEADVTYWQKKNALFPVLLAWRRINTVCWDVLVHTRIL